MSTTHEHQTVLQRFAAQRTIDSPMNYQQLLHDYFDGILNQDQEAALFSALQSQEELRDELRSLLLMRKAARHDGELYSPPMDSTNAIFGRLGLATGAPQVVGQGSGSQAAAVPAQVGRRWWEGYVQALAGGVVAAILILLFLKIGGYALSINPAHGVVETANSTATTVSPKQTEDVHLLGDDDSAEQYGNNLLQTVPLQTTHPQTDRTAQALASIQRQAAQLERLIAKYDAALQGLAIPTNPKNSADSPDLLSSQTPSTQEDKEQPDRNSAPPLAAQNSLTDSTVALLPVPNNSAERSTLALPEPEESEEHLSPFGVEYRRIESQNIKRVPTELVKPADAFLMNSAVSLTYRLNESEELGATVGQERFYQHFQEVAANNDMIDYQQNPLLYWGGLTYRRQFLRSTKLNPWVQLMAGGTRIGPTARVGVGLQYQLTPVLRLFAGGELSGIMYSQSSAQHLASKYGLTYGAAFRY